MRFSVRRFVAIIVFIFTVLTVASIASGNDLGWGLDYFPDTSPPLGMGIVQGLAYMSLLGAVGLLWFRGFVVGDVDERSKRLAIIFSVITLVLHIVLVPFIRVWEAGGDTFDIFNLDYWQVEARASSLRALLTLVIGLPIQLWFAYSNMSVTRNRWFMLTGGLIALGSLTVVGHTANLPPTWLTHGADFVHGTGAAFWFGGLLGLVVYLKYAFADRGDAIRAGEILGKFSTFALYSVVALAASGTVMAWKVKDDPLDLTGTPFSRTLLLKLSLVSIPIVIAAYNRFKLIPNLKTDSDSDAAWSTLKRTSLAEMAVLVAILFVTGFLVLQSPVP